MTLAYYRPPNQRATRIDWPALTTALAFKLAGNWQRHWFALQAALAADGLDFHRDTLRAIGSGRRRPSDPDLVAWLLRTADRLGIPVPALPARVDRPVLVCRGTDGEPCRSVSTERRP